MNPTGYVRLPSAPPAAQGAFPSPGPAMVALPSPGPAREALCVACHSPLHEPLVVCGCGCRLPFHPTCHSFLMSRRETCPYCGKFWSVQSSNASVISMPFTEALVERPLSNTECMPSCSTRWMLYSLAILVVGATALFVFFYYIK